MEVLNKMRWWAVLIIVIIILVILMVIFGQSGSGPFDYALS